ncbi:MAG TPA: YbhB/YbcL family Raf kinase inhibitor-like protein [Polyangia bacterium]
MNQPTKVPYTTSLLSLAFAAALGCGASDSPPAPGASGAGGSGGRSAMGGSLGSGGGGAGGGRGGAGGTLSGGAGGNAGGSGGGNPGGGAGGNAGSGGTTADASGPGDATNADAGRDAVGADAPADGAGGALVLTAPWPEGGNIPNEYSCAANNWPKISWTPGPPGTLSYAFALHDNDYDTHYVILDIPATVTSLPPVPAGTRIPKMGFATVNDMKWGGPCPPNGTHTYTLSVYALKTEKFVGAATSAPAVRTSLERATNTDVLAKAKYTGRRAAN